MHREVEVSSGPSTERVSLGGYPVSQVAFVVTVPSSLCVSVLVTNFVTAAPGGQVVVYSVTVGWRDAVFVHKGFENVGDAPPHSGAKLS